MSRRVTGGSSVQKRIGVQELASAGMATVQSVLGPIDTSHMGPTLVHEHLSISYPGDQLDPKSTWDRKANIEAGVERMSKLAEHGVRTIVDPCPIDLGADPGRCLIGHQDQATDSQQLVKLAERGTFVGVDRVGYDVLAPDDRRVELVMAMVEAGKGDRLCLSQDHMCCLRSPRLPYQLPEGMDSEQILGMLNARLHERRDFLFTGLRPALEAAGLDRGTFDSILTDNPRRLFGG